MIKLMKYELLRRKQMLIGGALSILFVEGVILFAIYQGGNWRTDGSGWPIFAFVMTMLLVVGGIVLTFLDAVIKLYSDFKQKHGYMIFMTPQNGYKVIWAKTIFALLEMAAAGVLIALCLAVSGMAADQVYSGGISKFLASLDVSMQGFFAGCISLGLLQFMAQLSIALLAVTVSRSVMRSSSYNWLIALLMYFALAVVVNMVDGALLLAFGIVGDIMRVSNNTAFIDSGLFAKYFIIGVVTYSAWFAGCTVLSGRLINRGIDL